MRAVEIHVERVDVEMRAEQIVVDAPSGTFDALLRAHVESGAVGIEVDSVGRRGVAQVAKREFSLHANLVVATRGYVVECEIDLSVGIHIPIDRIGEVEVEKCESVADIGIANQFAIDERIREKP